MPTQTHENLLPSDWVDVDSAEIRIILSRSLGRSGQYLDQRLFLPMGGPLCKLILVHNGSRITSINRGPAFDAVEWEDIRAAAQDVMNSSQLYIGRQFAFCSYRVSGRWLGKQSNIQILPPPAGTPSAIEVIADHPFVLEFPFRFSGFWDLDRYRIQRELDAYARLLNLFLRGRTSSQLVRRGHFWAIDPSDMNSKSKWCEEFFFGELGPVFQERVTAGTESLIDEVSPEEYYSISGHDLGVLRVPADLDERIQLYQNLNQHKRTRIDKALFWLDLSSRQWNLSASASFASIVTAIETMTDRGARHNLICPKCEETTNHEHPGATSRFRDFLEKYAPGVALAKSRNEMYALRSAISHGSSLMVLDQMALTNGDPVFWRQQELYDDLWRVATIALRHWLGTSDSDSSLTL